MNRNKIRYTEPMWKSRRNVTVNIRALLSDFKNIPAITAEIRGTAIESVKTVA